MIMKINDLVKRYKNMTKFQAFLQGMANILDLSGTSYSSTFEPGTFEDDAKAIASDWQAVYNDLDYAECYFDNKNEE